MLVDNILQAKGGTVHTVSADASVSDAIQILNTYNIGAVVVVGEGGGVVGILSERDVVRHLGNDPVGALARAVSECMTPGVITATRNTTVALVMERMTQFRIRHLPIVEPEGLVGIVSIGDVVKRKIEEAEQEAEAMREYISSGVA